MVKNTYLFYTYIILNW